PRLHSRAPEERKVDIMGDPKSNGKVSPPLLQRPTAVRYGVLALLVGMAVLLYLARICISIAQGAIPEAPPLPQGEMSLVFSPFFFASALGQVPAGWLGDRLGARLLLVACVLLWSLCTALTGWATGLLSLLVVRLLFGLAQAGAYPVAARVNSLWM